MKNQYKKGDEIYFINEDCIINKTTIKTIRITTHFTIKNGKKSSYEKYMIDTTEYGTLYSVNKVSKTKQGVINNIIILNK